MDTTTQLEALGRRAAEQVPEVKFISVDYYPVNNFYEIVFKRLADKAYIVVPCAGEFEEGVEPDNLIAYLVGQIREHLHEPPTIIDLDWS